MAPVDSQIGYIFLLVFVYLIQPKKFCYALFFVGLIAISYEIQANLYMIS